MCLFGSCLLLLFVCVVACVVFVAWLCFVFVMNTFHDVLVLVVCLFVCVFVCVFVCMFV